MSHGCNGWVTLLRGELVLFTGTAYVKGEQMVRQKLRDHTRRLGGRVAPDRSREVTVLVHGDLKGRSLTDPERGYSQKLVFIERTMREMGRHIHVIDDAGFGELLDGRPARCHELRSSSGRVVADRAREPNA